MARSIRLTSSTSIASAMNSSSSYAAACIGRSLRPLPRGSNANTVWRRANQEICAFHIWALTIGSAWKNKMAGPPAPNRSQCTCTPSRSMNPLESGSRALIGIRPCRVERPIRRIRRINRLTTTGSRRFGAWPPRRSSPAGHWSPPPTRPHWRAGEWRPRRRGSRSTGQPVELHAMRNHCGSDRWIPR